MILFHLRTNTLRASRCLDLASPGMGLFFLVDTSSVFGQGEKPGHPVASPWGISSSASSFGNHAEWMPKAAAASAETLRLFPEWHAIEPPIGRSPRYRGWVALGLKGRARIWLPFQRTRQTSPRSLDDGGMTDSTVMFQNNVEVINLLEGPSQALQTGRPITLTESPSSSSELRTTPWPRRTRLRLSLGEVIIRAQSGSHGIRVRTTKRGATRSGHPQHQPTLTQAARRGFGSRSFARGTLAIEMLDISACKFSRAVLSHSASSRQ